jgi:hypothetical protein
MKSGPPVGVSLSLRRSSSVGREPRCRTPALALVPLEDWDIRLDRLQSSFTIGDRLSAGPPFVSGLAPSTYSANFVSGTCRLTGDPTIDLQLGANGEASIESLEPGTVLGGLHSPDQTSSYEVLLTPADFSAAGAGGKALSFSIFEVGMVGGLFAVHKRTPTSYFRDRRLSVLIRRAGPGPFVSRHIPVNAVSQSGSAEAGPAWPGGFVKRRDLLT